MNVILNTILATLTIIVLTVIGGTLTGIPTIVVIGIAFFQLATVFLLYMWVIRPLKRALERKQSGIH